MANNISTKVPSSNSPAVQAWKGFLSHRNIAGVWTTNEAIDRFIKTSPIPAPTGLPEDPAAAAVKIHFYLFSMNYRAPDGVWPGALTKLVEQKREEDPANGDFWVVNALASGMKKIRIEPVASRLDDALPPQPTLAMEDPSPTMTATDVSDGAEGEEFEASSESENNSTDANESASSVVAKQKSHGILKNPFLWIGIGAGTIALLAWLLARGGTNRQEKEVGKLNDMTLTARTVLSSSDHALTTSGHAVSTGLDLSGAGPSAGTRAGLDVSGAHQAIVGRDKTSTSGVSVISPRISAAAPDRQYIPFLTTDGKANKAAARAVNQQAQLASSARRTSSVNVLTGAARANKSDSQP